MNNRTAVLERKTKETNIKIELNVDGKGEYKGKIKIPFFEHMLDLFTKHSLFDLTIYAEGDIEVDYHHTVEDVGITLGKAFKKALGDKKGIVRYGSAFCPMEEVLARTVVDICERPFLVYRVPSKTKAKVGEYDVELTEEFMRAFAINAGLTLHITVEYGSNLHHIHEAIFKSLGMALQIATRYNSRIEGVLSTKGVL